MSLMEFKCQYCDYKSHWIIERDAHRRKHRKYWDYLISSLVFDSEKKELEKLKEKYSEFE